MTNVQMQEYIDRVIKLNGTGHKEIQELVISGKISQEDAWMIFLIADTHLASTKLDTLLQKVENVTIL